MSNSAPPPASAGGTGAPAGSPYDWYVRGARLLDAGHAAAAAELLGRLVAAEPTARSARETLARAQFDAGRYAEAAASFRVLAEASPDDDYAHFGLGLALWRLGRFRLAREHLAAAAVMRPSWDAAQRALRQVDATLAARAEAGLPPDGAAAAESRLDGRTDADSPGGGADDSAQARDTTEADGDSTGAEA
ncbi:MAG: tetratricopeptide repeat protein [Actinomycetota bacterium]|nr:MAG: tetratricopeptide repeat protein [Actinomycetota bacterium]